MFYRKVRILTASTEILNVMTKEEKQLYKLLKPKYPKPGQPIDITGLIELSEKMELLEKIEIKKDSIYQS